MTYDEERKRLEERHARDLARLEREREIRTMIPDDLSRDLHVTYHPYALYGHSGSLKISGEKFYSVTKQDSRQPTLQDVIRLAEIFPEHAPIGLLRSAGTTSIQEFSTLADRDSGTVARLEPYWIEIEPSTYTGMTATIHWTAKIGSEFVRIDVEFPLHSAIGRAIGSLDLYIDRYYDGRPKKVTRNLFDVNPEIRAIGNGSVTQIRYASGSKEAPGRHLIAWKVDAAEPSTTVADLARAIEGQELISRTSTLKAQ
jgi:hypothetical protein